MSMSVATLHNRGHGLFRFHYFVWNAMQYGNGETGAGGACKFKENEQDSINFNCQLENEIISYLNLEICQLLNEDFIH